jgi:large subunit ribosomal protein L25
VLEHITHQVLVEALPTSIPESISHDVSEMTIGDTVMLAAVAAPEGVTLLGELEETVLATLTPPRLRLEEESEIEQETELVGEAGSSEEAASEDGAAEPSDGDGE